MQNSLLYVSGSIHQGHELFSDISRGRQCSFMSFSALLYAQVNPIEQWRRFTVDQILIQGDSMYLNALQRGHIPDTETISLNYLPNRARSSLSLDYTSTLRNQLFLETTQRTQLETNQTPQSNTNLPIVVEPIEAQNQTNIQLPIVVGPSEAPTNTNNINSWWLINYKEFYQGRIVSDEHENEAPYFTLHSALMNTFIDNNYAFIVLDGYIMALMKSVDGIYVFDSHSRNCCGMPDENGTAVVMKCANIDN